MIVQNKKTFASILFVLISFVCSSQTDGTPPPPAPPPPPGLPIDSALPALLLVALIFGVYKSLKKVKQ